MDTTYVFVPILCFAFVIFGSRGRRLWQRFILAALGLGFGVAASLTGYIHTGPSAITAFVVAMILLVALGFFWMITENRRGAN
jgi:hypothetical protein